MTLEHDIVGKRNDYCLYKVLAYATEVFSTNEGTQSHLVDRWSLSMNAGYFLWEQVESHCCSDTLTEIFTSLIRSGCELLGPESSLRSGWLQ
jgi:hypothetical protein